MCGELENAGGYMHGLSCISMVEPEGYVHDEKRLLVEEKTNTFKNFDKTAPCSSSSTSSIGENSDISGISLDNNVSKDTEEEVQSSYKSPLDAMQPLEDVLPIRKGISRSYNGKSKSFANLADAASCKELTKPENAYAKRRRNLLAYSMAWDKNRSSSILRNSSGGIAKRVHGTTRSSLALAAAMNSLATSNSSDNLHSEHESASISPTPSHCCRVHPRLRELQADCSTPSLRGNLSAWRSFSHADLQECASSIVPTLQTETDSSLK
ncbi:hypothetical protein LIER_01470 [Lithospermum erythrorhizon]|uniref:Uncharacterized protein n=1 Tax=Lithospermum erythrorhizon TaxID=34254 RepID=A0AAV3NQL3_LITER